MTEPLLPSLPGPGEELVGKYRVVRVIGEGGMGVVYEAIHLRLNKRVAIKMVLAKMLAFPDVLMRFDREARAAAQLQSAHVAKVVDVDTTPAGVPFMVMEYLEGNDLSKELAKRKSLPLDEAVRWMLQACVAIGEAHQLGIVHRDLKPSNLFLAQERGKRVLKILDFGISKMTTENDVSATQTQAQLGTPLYMSPEQVRSSKHVDSRTDIWSLGVIFYQMLAGKAPFTGDTMTAVAAAIVADEARPLHFVRPDVPLVLDSIVAAALSKDPRGRFPTAEAFAQVLAPFGDGYVSSIPNAPITNPASHVFHASAPGHASASDPRVQSPPTVREWTWGASQATAGRRRVLGIVVAALLALSAVVVAAQLILRARASKIAPAGEIATAVAAPPRAAADPAPAVSAPIVAVPDATPPAEIVSAVVSKTDEAVGQPRPPPPVRPGVLRPASPPPARPSAAAPSSASTPAPAPLPTSNPNRL